MSKILLAQKNTVWGVIVNPNSANNYRHILRFDNEQLKDDFINQELFNGEDYKTLIDSQPSVSFTEITAVTAEFVININDYPKETFNSLLNKDFAIIKEDGKYRFYTLSAKREDSSPFLIKYSAELDIFFTYDVTKMFNNSQSRIERSHLPRVKNGIFDLEWNFNKGTDLHLKEQQISSEFGDRYTESSQELNGIIDAEFIPFNKQEQGQKALNNTHWVVAYVRDDKSSPSLTKLQIKEKESLPIPYGVYTVPITFGSVSTNFTGTDSKKTEVCDVARFIKKFASDSKTLAMTIVPYCPIDFLPELGDPSQIKVNVKDDSTFGTVIDIEESVFAPFPIVVIDDSSQQAYFAVRKAKRLPLSTPNLTKYINKLKPDKKLFKPTEKFNIATEPKLLIYPFFSIDLSSVSGNTFPIEYNRLYNDILHLNYLNAYTPETYKESIFIDSGIYKSNAIKKYKLQNQTAYTLALSTDAWNEYVNNHRISEVTGQIGLFANAGMSAGGGFAMGGPAGGVAGLLKGGLDAMNFYSERGDIKNAPDRVSQTSSNLNLDIMTASLKPKISFKQLPDEQRKLVASYFHQTGYSLNKKLDTINKYIQSRYYFNYLKIPETFENIILQASGEIKQLINDTFANGVTIWHVRDLETFKGIKNYDYDNTEMELV